MSEWTESRLVLHSRLCGNETFHDSEYVSESAFRACYFISDECKTLADLNKSDAIGKLKIHGKRKLEETLEEVEKIQQEKRFKEAVRLTSSTYYNGTVTHWLPEYNSRLLAVVPPVIDDEWQKILDERYEEFDTVCHATHLHLASEILKDDLKFFPVKDNSVFSKVPDHPNKDTEICFFGPAVKSELQRYKIDSLYGNVVFYMETLAGYEGITRFHGYPLYLNNSFNYYFVEVIDYKYKSASRILVTRENYPYLRKYDPTEKGGPWYHDKVKGKHYWLKNISRWDGTMTDGGHSLEIMREKNDDTRQATWFRENLRGLYVHHRKKCIRGLCNTGANGRVDYMNLSFLKLYAIQCKIGKKIIQLDEVYEERASKLFKVLQCNWAHLFSMKTKEESMPPNSFEELLHACLENPLCHCDDEWHKTLAHFISAFFRSLERHDNDDCGGDDDDDNDDDDDDDDDSD